MPLSPNEAQQFGELIGLTKSIKETVDKNDGKLEEVEKKADKALKEVGKIKTIAKTITGVATAIWAAVTFLWR